MAISDIEREYINNSSWETKENANRSISYNGLKGYILRKVLLNPSVLVEYFPKSGVEGHFNGDIHIHKLPDSIWIPYCAGWSYSLLLKKGLITPKIVSKPAKHFDVALSHLINMFFMGCEEWSGAQATSHLDLYVSPFANYDHLDYRSVKQNFQRFLFDLNYPTRSSYESPFTNITIMLDTIRSSLSQDAIVGGKVVGVLGDFIDEAILVTKALLDLYIEGDAVGQPFTFPIPTLILTRDFDWNERKWDDLTYKIFYSLATKGTLYLLNGYATNVESLYSMCCRLTLDVSKILNNNIELVLDGSDEKYAYGVWALPDATGSIGVVTINLPRLAILSKGEWDKFEEMLYDRLELARSILMSMRKKYNASLSYGLMPITKTYVGHLRHHFNTIGVLGLPETVVNLMNMPNLWFDLESRSVIEAIELSKRIVSYINTVVKEFEDKDCCLYNVEEVPAESCSYRLAMSDYIRFKSKVERGDVFIPTFDGVPIYSNSIVPYYAKLSIPQRAKFEGEVQREFTGGVMMHLFLREQPDVEALKKLVYRIATQTRVVYFSITPTLTVCLKCKTSYVGIYSKCPKCGSKSVDVWSRIVGYYRPVKDWNIGRRAEFKSRVHYVVQ